MYVVKRTTRKEHKNMWNIENETGYKPLTTLYEDFSIAEPFGRSALEDTYKNALIYVKNDYKLFTELVMVLNWKIWALYRRNEQMARVYDGLWRKAESEFFEKYEEDEEEDEDDDL